MCLYFSLNLQIICTVTIKIYFPLVSEFLLNQFLGFNRDVYLLKSSFPRSNAPAQNVTSPITKSIAEIVTLAPFPIDRNGMTGIARNAKTHIIRRTIPHLKYRFRVMPVKFKLKYKDI